MDKPKKLILIPPKVKEMADFIQECTNDSNCAGYVIKRARGCGITMATNLALNTNNAEFEIIQPKQIENGDNKG